MKNNELILKILERINIFNNESYTLNTPIEIDGEILTHITVNNEESGIYRYCLTNDTWEIPLSDLKNRELRTLSAII